MMFPNQMNHPMGGGPGMGQHQVGGGPQQYPHRAPGADFRQPSFGQMMPPQSQHMGYQGGQNYPKDFGGMGGMGNMMPPGQGSMGMNPNQHPGMGGMRPTGINPNIPRPNLSQGHGMAAMGMKQHMLSRSLSMPQQMTPGNMEPEPYGQPFQQPQLQRANSMLMTSGMGSMQGGQMPSGSGQMPVSAGPWVGTPGNMRWNNSQMNPNQGTASNSGMVPPGMNQQQMSRAGTMTPGSMSQGMGPDMFGSMQPNMDLTSSARNRRTPVGNMTTTQVMGRIDVNTDFMDAQGNYYNIHMTNHTQGPLLEVLDIICNFIFDTAISGTGNIWTGWVEVMPGDFVYWIHPGSHLYVFLDAGAAQHPYNFLCFRRNGNGITITNFGPFSWNKGWDLKKVQAAMKHAEDLAKEAEKERERMEEVHAKVLKKGGELVAREAQLNAAVKVAVKDLAKTGAKAALMSACKEKPFLGILTRLGFGAWRAHNDDFAGGRREVASAAAALVLGPETIAFIATDSVLLGKDIYDILKKLKEQQELYDREVQEWRAKKRLMEQRIEEISEAIAGYNRCVESCYHLIELCHR